MSKPTLESLGYSSKAELLDALAREEIALGGRLHTFELNSPLLLDVCGALELALRHPQFPRNSRFVLRGFLDQIITGCKENGLRAHAALLELSRHPANDVTIWSTNGGE